MGLHISKKICEKLNGGMTVLRDATNLKKVKLAFTVSCLKAARVLNRPQSSKFVETERQNILIFTKNYIDMISLKVTLVTLGVKEANIKPVQTVAACINAIVNLHCCDQGFAMVIFEKGSRMSDTSYARQIAEFKKLVAAVGVPASLLPHIVSLKKLPQGGLSGKNDRLITKSSGSSKDDDII